MGGFAFKLCGKGEHSGKTVQPCGDAFGGKIDIRVQGLQVPQAFVITAAAGGAEQVHVFFGQVVAFNKSLDDARCGGVHHFKCKGNTAQFLPYGLSTAPAAAARHLRCQNAR